MGAANEFCHTQPPRHYGLDGCQILCAASRHAGRESRRSEWHAYSRTNAIPTSRDCRIAGLQNCRKGKALPPSFLQSSKDIAGAQTTCPLPVIAEALPGDRV